MASLEDGSQALLNGEWQKAVDAFTESIEAMPTAKAYINRGIAYGRLGKPEETLDNFNAVIRLEPKEPVAYLNRANLYERGNQPDKAIADFTTALKLKPTSTTYAIRGTEHQKAKEYAKAREDYRAALKLNPKELIALNNFAWLQATCPNSDFRDGKSAVDHATNACQLTQWRAHGYVSTLAAAFAEAEGRHPGRADQGRASGELPGGKADR